MSKQLNKTVSRTITRTLLGLASALVLAAGAHATPKIVKKVPPEFPPEAARQSISQGSVRAKMNIEPDGKVSGVEILEAEPRKVFDKAVTRALMDWKFEPSGQKETHEVKLVFKNED